MYLCSQFCVLMLRLSFIVPVFGVEKYIEECIRSLYHQDIPKEEYEVICVDDCSPDNSAAIIERLQSEYPTLKLLRHTENKRQGGARNTGLREAQGRYVWFIDSDDYIQPNCLKALLNQAESEQLDVLQIYYAYNGKIRTDMIEYGPCTGSQYVFEAPMTDKPAIRCCCVCEGLVLRDLLVRNNIWFAEHVQFEDDDYAYLMFAAAQRVHLMPLPVYFVRVRPNSTMHSRHSLLMTSYYAKQVARFVAIEPTLRLSDTRWTRLVREMVQWTCRELILVNLAKLSPEEQHRFFDEKMGFISGLHKFVSWKMWLAMHFYICYKKWFAK